MLRWSQRARADLKAIHDYIAKDSPLNAKAVARELLQRKRSGNRVLAFALPKSATGGIEGAEYQQTDDADCGHGFGYKNAMTWVEPRAESPVRNDDENRHYE